MAGPRTPIGTFSPLPTAVVEDVIEDVIEGCVSRSNEWAVNIAFQGVSLVCLACLRRGAVTGVDEEAQVRVSARARAARRGTPSRACSKKSFCVVPAR